MKKIFIFFFFFKKKKTGSIYIAGRDKELRPTIVIMLGDIDYDNV